MTMPVVTADSRAGSAASAAAAPWSASRMMPTMKMKSSAGRRSCGRVKIFGSMKVSRRAVASCVDDERPRTRRSPGRARARISREENQSSCSPRSSIICSAPMASASMAKPKKSKRRSRLPVSGRKSEDAEEGEDADRQVDVEHPAPVEDLGQPAAERRPDDRADHDAGAPDRHRLAVPLPAG